MTLLLQTRVFPRRKKGESPRSPAPKIPIFLTRDDLKPMFDFPLSKAARILNISVTALKAVCRKLEVSCAKLA